MQIQKDTRRLILNDLIARGDIVGELEASEFVRKVFPDAENMSSEDHRYTTFLEEVWKHMEMNNDWTWDYVLFHRLNLLEVDDDKFILAYCVFLILYITLLRRAPGYNESIRLRLKLWTNAGVWAGNLLNLLLYIPYGATSWQWKKEGKKIVLIHTQATISITVIGEANIQALLDHESLQTLDTVS